MKGQFLGGTRKLNRHWQSGGAKYKYWDFDSGNCRICLNLMDKQDNIYEFAPAYVRFAGFSFPTEIYDIAGLSGIKAYDYGSSDFYPRPSTYGVLANLPFDTVFPHQWYLRGYVDRNGTYTSDWNEWSTGPEVMLVNMFKEFVVFNVQTYAFLSDRYLSNVERDKIVNALKRNIRIPRKYEPIFANGLLATTSGQVMGYNNENFLYPFQSKAIYELDRNFLAYVSDDFVGQPNSYVKTGWKGYILTTRLTSTNFSSDLNHYYMSKVTSPIIPDSYLNDLDLFVPYRTFVLLDANYSADPAHPYAYVLHMLNSLDVKYCALRGTYTP